MAYDTLKLYNVGSDESKQINQAIEDLIRAAHNMGLQQAYAEIYPTDLQVNKHRELVDVCIEKHINLNAVIIAALQKD